MAEENNNRKWLFTKYLEHQGEWLEISRGNLLVVATVLATISFQVAVNPPGGVWQQDDGCGPAGHNCTRIAGTSVLENSKFGSKDAIFHELVTLCMVSFTLSMATIYILLLGFSFRSKLVAILVFGMMGAAVATMVVVFKHSLKLIHSNNASIQSRLLIYDWFCFFIFVVFPNVFVAFYFAILRCRRRSNRYSRPSDQSPSSNA
ncbi:PREDICTED: uncharacterized protein LOC104822653 [Tarenaya hassleriana]|uniref:uncharacterized protein LOC104822653 n=1 Tax=Tarenaya hassleriana TaxID=28532 RepID=UPI00053C206E|nr:PREDICTED: uncharacterized protein LOC104822653 [Tarenaya hassleriana]